MVGVAEVAECTLAQLQRRLVSIGGDEPRRANAIELHSLFDTNISENAFKFFSDAKCRLSVAFRS